MEGSYLLFAHDEQLLSVGLYVLIELGIAVADGEYQQALLGEIPEAEVGDVPPEHVVPDFIVLVPLGLPVLGTPGGEGRQMEVHPPGEFKPIADNLVNLGPLHCDYLASM